MSSDEANVTNSVAARGANPQDWGAALNWIRAMATSSTVKGLAAVSVRQRGMGRMVDGLVKALAAAAPAASGWPRRAHSVILAGPLPPPVHGMSQVTRRVVNLARARVGRDHRLICVSTSGGGLAKTPQYHALRLGAHLRVVGTMLRRRLAGPVTLYLAGDGGLGLAYQALLVLVARVAGCRTVFHHHSYNYLRGPRSPWMRLICRLQRPSDSNIVLTQHMADEFGSRYPSLAEVLRVSNSFVVPGDQPPASQRSSAERVLVHISNLSAEKGTGLVLDAFAQLRQRRRPYSLILVGPAVEPAIESRIRDFEEQFATAFRYIGSQDTRGVLAALDEAHLMVFPSQYRHEAEPLVVLESLSRGVPAVVSRRGSMITMVPEDWQIRPGAVVADEIERVLQHDWSVLSAQARATFEAMQADADILIESLQRIG